MSDYVRLDLTADELHALYVIGGDIRQCARGLAGRGSIGNQVAKRGGLRVHASIRALLAMEDLRRHKLETFEGLARGIGMPSKVDAWMDLWDSIDHPAVAS
jgi:hypothetical protein